MSEQEPAQAEFSIEHANSKVPQVIVSMGLLFRDRNILIARRPPGRPFAGYYEFPGGKVDPGESLETALARELFEEIGIRVQRHHYVLTTDYTFPDRHVTLNVFEVLDYEGDPSPCEGQELFWIDPASMGDYLFPPGNTPIVAWVQKRAADLCPL